MTTLLLWAVFLAFLVLVVLAPMVRWFARLVREETTPRRVPIRIRRD